MSKHAGSYSRTTKETQIELSVIFADLQTPSTLDTPVHFLNHMLQQLVTHGQMSIQLHAKGDVHIDDHHLVEDIGITFGKAISQAIGDKKGMARYGHAYAPLDESLSRSVIDLSGRPGLFYNCAFTRARIGTFDTDLIREFFQGFVNHANVTLHLDQIRGQNAHHQAESLFKSFALALRKAATIETQHIASTKGVL